MTAFEETSAPDDRPTDDAATENEPSGGPEFTDADDERAPDPDPAPAFGGDDDIASGHHGPTADEGDEQARRTSHAQTWSFRTVTRAAAESFDSTQLSSPHAHRRPAREPGAVDFARQHGAPAVEGYPVDNQGSKVDTVMAYVGTRSLFEASGFTLAAQTSAVSGGFPRVVMRHCL